MRVRTGGRVVEIPDERMAKAEGRSVKEQARAPRGALAAPSPLIFTLKGQDGLPERILNNVEKVTESGCWIWMKGGVKGYGRTKFNGTKILVHRLMYILSGKTIPEGYTIDHLCRVPACCNPDHLEAVTFNENVIRGIGPTAINKRKTHCDSGHEFTASNTYITKTGGRSCRACERESYKRNKDQVLKDRKDYYRRNKEAVKARARAYRLRMRAANE